MKIYVNNTGRLTSKMERFYLQRYEKLKKEGYKVNKSEMMTHFKNSSSILKKESLDFDLSQPTYDEWVSKGYKQFIYKDWYFAVEYVVRSNG